MRSPTKHLSGKIILILTFVAACLSLKSGNSFASTPEVAVDEAKKWATEWLGSHPTGLEELELVKRVAIFESLKISERPKFQTINPDDIASVSYTTPIDPNDGFLSYELNPPKADRAASESPYDTAFNLLQVDAILSLQSNAQGRQEWEIATREGPKVITKTIHPPNSKDASAIAGWLHRSIGYDAIVVDTKEDLMLVTGARGVFAKKNQGLLLRESSDLKVIQDRSAPVAGIVRIVGAWENFAIIRVVIGKAAVAKTGGLKGVKVIFPVKTSAK